MYEVDHLRMNSLEQMRSIFNEGTAGMVLISMPGIEKRVTASLSSTRASGSSMNSVPSVRIEFNNCSKGAKLAIASSIIHNLGGAECNQFFQPEQPVNTAGRLFRPMGDSNTTESWKMRFCDLFLIQRLNRAGGLNRLAKTVQIDMPEMR
jgi:hypothetical protein